MLATVLTQLHSEGPRHYDDDEIKDAIRDLKKKTDLRKYLAPVLEHARDFGDYVQARCIAPDHHDTQSSLLVYPDQCRCQACSFKADILDLYRQQHPDVRLMDAISNLMADPSLTFTGEVKARELRGLPQELATRYHLALAEHPEALAGLEAMGFTREAIVRFQLGVATVPVRLEDDTFAEQVRFSVPVFKEGRLVQVLYRKSNKDDGGPKVTMEKGAGVHLFNVDALRDTTMAVYCEGWGDSIAFSQAGIVAVTSTSGAGHFNEEWSDLLGHLKQLYVVGDADEAGQKMMRRFKERLPWAKPLELPWLAGTKRDIRDLWLAGWRQKEFYALLRQAEMKASWHALKRGK